MEYFPDLHNYCLLTHILILLRLEVIGKFPSNQEAIKYKLEKGKIAWMPTDNLPWFDAFMRYLGGPEPSQSTSSAAEIVPNLNLDLE